MLKAYYQPGHGYRDACLQAEETAEAGMWSLLNQLSPSPQADFQKQKSNGMAGQFVKITQTSCTVLLICIFPILVPFNN